ncbi:MAG: helix-turn-helix transcriptional regulator [Bacteroidales bacterium]
MKIPSYVLQHNGSSVDFSIKQIHDVVKQFGPLNDVPHRHEYYTVLWSQNESGIHRIDYKEYKMTENDIFFVTPDQVHQVINNNKPEGIVILFTCNFLEKNLIDRNFIINLGLFNEVGDSPPIKIDTAMALRLASVCDEMIKIDKSEQAFKYDSLGAWLKLFLIECNKFAHHAKTSDTQSIQSSKNIARKFKDLLDLHHNQWHKVGQYADMLNISPDYLNATIKTSIGKTAKELIQQRIVLEAKRLGLHTTLSTKEIAYQLGFEDPTHFSRFFKKEENLSFADFRKVIEIEMNK